MRRVLLGAAVLAAVLGPVVPWRRVFPNFGVVVPGRVYRSAQPEGRVARVVREHRLASVLNLRAGSLADPFYVEELRTTEALGVDFYDFPMDAGRRPTRRELLTLLDLFGRCRYPLLIHCKSGADRTGLVSALYLLAVEGRPPREARRAFTLRHGHVPVLGAQRLHEPIDEYHAWLGRRRLAHTPERFRAWVETEYQSPDRAAAVRPLRPGPRPQIARGRAAARPR